MKRKQNLIKITYIVLFVFIVNIFQIFTPVSAAIKTKYTVKLNNKNLGKIAYKYKGRYYINAKKYASTSKINYSYNKKTVKLKKGKKVLTIKLKKTNSFVIKKIPYVNLKTITKKFSQKFTITKKTIKITAISLPIAKQTIAPTVLPTAQPTTVPTHKPDTTIIPTDAPTLIPVFTSTPPPSYEPSPTVVPTIKPTYSDHSIIPKESFYRYSQLDNSSKQLYNEILNSFKNLNRTINIQDYQCNDDELEAMFTYVVSDNPELFYVANSYYFSYSPSGNVQNVYFRFFDGTNIDDYNRYGNLMRATTANLNTIQNKIVEFENKVNEVIETIPASDSEFLKELKIHNYIMDNVTYDFNAVETGNPEDHYYSYTVYNALINGKGVCEAYSELFQYMCYKVGINANIVHGSIDSVPHQWNIVKIENEWYQIDPTWNDTNEAQFPTFNYFNITTEKMKQDHMIDTSIITIPSCISTNYSYIDYFLINVDSRWNITNNLSLCIQMQMNMNQNHLLLYSENTDIDLLKRRLDAQLINQTLSQIKPTAKLNISAADSSKKFVYIPLQ